MTRRQMNRTPLLYLTLGFLAGVIVSRNAATMSNPDKGAVFVGFLLLAFFVFRAGSRGKAEAVAIATANATAIATANAKASAQATAQQAVQIVLQQSKMETPQIESWKDAWDYAAEEIERDEEQSFNLAAMHSNLKDKELA